MFAKTRANLNVLFDKNQFCFAGFVNVISNHYSYRETEYVFRATASGRIMASLEPMSLIGFCYMFVLIYIYMELTAKLLLMVRQRPNI